MRFKLDLNVGTWYIIPCQRSIPILVVHTTASIINNSGIDNVLILTYSFFNTRIERFFLHCEPSSR